MPKEDDRLTAPALTAALHDLLPSTLERQCLFGDEVRNLDVCVPHLDALLRTITTYLPRQVVLPLLEEPQMGQVRGTFTHGTVMFADISGFTAMSETLSQLGKEGAEEVTSIINRLFTTLLEVADRYGGDLLKFGGDALLLFFGDEAHALSACMAALDMQETMGQFSETSTSQGIFRLRMSVGVGTGPLFMAHLGSEEGDSPGMEFAVMGRAMTQMAQAESRASAGEIFIDDETRRALSEEIGERANLQEVEADPSGKKGAAKPPVTLHQLLGLPASITPPTSAVEDPLAAMSLPPADKPLARVEETIRRIQALSLFLPPGLLEKIKLEPERVAIGGEYRPVTVFFANFYGINEIIETLGDSRSAEITAILNAHFATMREIIAKYGGVVNKVDTYAVGHRIMTLFGAPRAHIDDPERAVRAALDMQEAMDGFTELETSCGTFSLKQRIGINTGLVFAGNVGSPTRQEYSVMGDEVNLAARLMGIATEGQVLISQSTARQSAGVFLLQEQEPVRVKGKSQPVSNYDAIGVRERRVRERHPLVGREQEWAAIHDLTDQALEGEPRILTLVGNAGLGKSRLLEEVTAHWHEDHGALSINASCPSFGRHTPYLPWLDILRALFGFNPADSPPVKLDKIKALLQEVDPTWRDWTVLLGRLLGVDVEETALIRALDAETRQRIVFNVVGELVNHIAGEQPLLLAIDDIQWADETSLELINHVAQQVTGRPFLLALAHRPEESLALDIADLPHHTELRLEELSDDDSLRLLDTLLPTTPQMPQQLKALILKNAQGNPLFIEAVAHSLIENYLTLDEESGTYHARADLEEVEVPDSVNRVIMSRIDRLDESSRSVIKVASVIGQEFRYWLLSEIYPHRRAEGELRERLKNLSQREILEGPYPDMLYLFRHILTREVAYESLLYADRRQLHRRIGQSIERQQAQRLTEYWEVLAYHFSLAEDWEKAMDYHLKAGRKAQEMYANEDAVHHYRRALEDAERVEDGERLSRQQLEAHEGLAEVLDTLGKYDQALAQLEAARGLVPGVGFSGEEAARRRADLCRRTAAICRKRSDYDTAFEWLHNGLKVLEGIEPIEAARIYLLGAGVYQRQGRSNKAIEWCNKGLAIAGKVGGREGRSVVAHADYLLGFIYYRLGDTARTIELCQKSREIYEQLEDMPQAAKVYTNLANAYFDRGKQGDWSRATKHYLRDLEIRRKIGDVYGQAMITLNLGQACLDQGNLDQANKYNWQSLKMWQDLDSDYMIAVLHNNMGTVALREGETNEALTLLQESLKMFQQIGSTDFLPEVYRHQVLAHLDLGELDEALKRAQHSLELAQKQEMRLEEGATRRVLGQVHLARGELAQAEQELEESLRILEELNSRYEVGKTCFQLARLYHEWQVAGGEWQEYLERARGIFEDLGAQWDLAQVENADWQD